MFELAALAYLIDKVFGEFPCKHPVQFMGDFIKQFEQRFYRDSLLPGALLTFCLLAITLLISIVITTLCGFLPDGLSLIALAVVSSTGLAKTMLHNSVAGVLTADDPKRAVGLLVSRDTETMNEADVYKAAIETWAENLSDGVIAPLFYLLLFGLPGIAVYKAINTMDSMIAYKTERYFYFGKTAAILDDIANYLPARLTAVLIVVLAEDKVHAWRCLWRDGNKLESPNAGYPIAAMAGAMGVALGLAINPISQATLVRALALAPRIDFIVLSFLAMGILFDL
jgi:adenosylcobinamide-phosphate synthase